MGTGLIIMSHENLKNSRSFEEAGITYSILQGHVIHQLLDRELIKLSRRNYPVRVILQLLFSTGGLKVGRR